MPLGYNQYLDDLILEGHQLLDNQYYMKHISGRTWREVTWDEIKNISFNREINWSSANELVVCVNTEMDSSFIV